MNNSEKMLDEEYITEGENFHVSARNFKKVLTICNKENRII